jgi:hypothetical protein
LIIVVVIHTRNTYTLLAEGGNAELDSINAFNRMCTVLVNLFDIFKFFDVRDGKLYVKEEYKDRVVEQSHKKSCKTQTNRQTSSRHTSKAFCTFTSNFSEPEIFCRQPSSTQKDRKTSQPQQQKNEISYLASAAEAVSEEQYTPGDQAVVQ